MTTLKLRVKDEALIVGRALRTLKGRVSFWGADARCFARWWAVRLREGGIAILRNGTGDGSWMF